MSDELEPRPARPVLEVESLTVAFGPRVVLRDVTFAVFPGERVAVVGPNGAGKSTLFKCIAGLLRPTHGRVVLAPPAERGAPALAYAPQQEAVNWHYPASVWDVVMMGRFPFYGLWRRPGPEDRRAVWEALEQVGLAHLARTPIQRLSGGQQQRVFLARALAQGAPLMVLDEPFNAVEQGAQAGLVEALGLLRPRRVAVMISTHDLDFVAGSHWFDRVLVLNGRLLAYGPPELVCARSGGGSLAVPWPEPAVCGGPMAG